MFILRGFAATFCHRAMESAIHHCKKRALSSEKGADGQGFEPWLPCGKHAFQACALDHSATHPIQLLLMFLILILTLRKDHEQDHDQEQEN